MEEIRVLNFGKGRENQGNQGWKGTKKGDFFCVLVWFVSYICVVLFLGRGKEFQWVNEK